MKNISETLFCSNFTFVEQRRERNEKEGVL
jgi:hypothetical protein